MGNSASKTPAKHALSEKKSCATRVAEAVARATSNNDVGDKIVSAYQLIQELQNYGDEQLPKAMVTKIKDTNIELFNFLNLVQEYVTEFGPEYDGLLLLQEEWKRESPSALKQKTREYFFNDEPSLLKRVVAKTKVFTVKMNKLILNVVEINQELHKGTHGMSTENWWLIALGVVCILGGVATAVVPIFVPLEAILVTAFVSAGSTALVAGSTFAGMGAVRDSKLKLYNDDLVAASDFLRDVLTNLHPTIRDHHHAAVVLEVLEKNGSFALLNAEKMCTTFRSLQVAFEKVINRKAGVSNSRAAVAATTAVAVGTAGGVTAALAINHL